jgi:malate dehydrogenase
LKISIIGAAGNIGSAAAFSIATNNIADDVVMIDSHSPDKLEQYVYDLSHAVTFRNIRVRAAKEEEMRDSDIVLMAAGSAQVVASRLEVLAPNLPIIQKVAGDIKRLCPKAGVIPAPNPGDPLNYGMYLASGLSRQQFLGYSLNDTIRFRVWLGEALGVRTSQVEAIVIGEHGNSQVPLFSSVRVNGLPVKVSEEIKRDIRHRLATLPSIIEPQRIKTGRTLAWTTAMGLASICRSISRNSCRMIPSSAILDGEYGCRNLGMSAPVVVGKEGVREILEWKLEPEEKQGLENSINTLRPAMEYVEKLLGVK